ncbi:MAG: hypothetical protein AB7G48_05330 [Nitrospiraceae bacterium]
MAMERQREWQRVPMWLLVASGVVRPADSVRPLMLAVRESGEADRETEPAVHHEAAPASWWGRIFHRQPVA